MIVEVKKIDTLKRELRFKVNKERVSQVLDDVYKEIGKHAQIKGFRAGNVPRHVLETHHGKLAQEETIKKLVPEVYREGIEKEKLEPIDLPEIENVLFKDGEITFVAKLDVKPEIKLHDYKGIKVQRKSSEVTAEDLQKTLEYFQKGQGQKENVALDDAFARGLGYPSLEELKKSLTHQLAMDKDRHNRLDVEHQIIEHVLKNTKFTVPESLVKKELERRVHETKRHMKSHGHSDDDIKKKEEELRKELNGVVERDVKVYLILDHIADAEKIDIKEGESLPAKVMEFLLKEAKWEEAK